MKFMINSVTRCAGGGHVIFRVTLANRRQKTVEIETSKVLELLKQDSDDDSDDGTAFERAAPFIAKEIAEAKANTFQKVKVALEGKEFDI